MKRALFTGIVMISCALGLHASDTPPPEQCVEWRGWQVITPSGGPVETDEETPLEFSEPQALGVGEMAQGVLTGAFALPPAYEPRGSVISGIGLSTNLPPDPDGVLAETARGLDYNWGRCYLYVRDNIRYTPYRGLARGPVRTLLDREGNDADQAFLLFALLRASGYNVKVAYANTNYYAIRLLGEPNGYDAVSLLGIPQGGTVAQITNAITRILQPSGVQFKYRLVGAQQDYLLYMEHFFVYLVAEQKYLDPSVKPRRIDFTGVSVLESMGYSRSNLLATAGGIVSNGWFAQNLSGQNLSNELNRLTSNLSDALMNLSSNNLAKALIGGDEIVPQDLTRDANTFHGGMYAQYLQDFHLMPGREYYRAQISISHGGITNTCYMDELGSRNLWVSYTNLTGYAYPAAVLHLDDSILAVEPAGSDVSDCIAQIGVYHRSLGYRWIASYMFMRSATNVYSIPVGFGSGYTAGGMIGRATRSLAATRNSGLSGYEPAVQARILHVLGQQWLAQSASAHALSSRLGGRYHHTLYDVGLAGFNGASYFDMKLKCSYSSQDGLSARGVGGLFGSALEHSVLDQFNGPGRPALSTVRILGLANGTGLPVYLATTSSWPVVSSLITGYDGDVLAYIEGAVTNGQSVLLPRDGQVSLGDWTGCGFLEFGSAGFSSWIKGMLNGGQPSQNGETPKDNVVMLGDPTVQCGPAENPEATSPDPIVMSDGAALLDRTDLSLSGPSPLVWERRYDSRQRWDTGPTGRGWTQRYESRVLPHPNTGPALGEGSAAACAASAVACSVVEDLLDSGESAQTMTVACLVADWWAGQFLKSGASVVADGKTLSFTRLPDGSYEPAPGVTASLSKDESGGFVLQERLGRTWSFATNGVLAQIEDPSGNRVGLAYEGMTNLVAVTNSFGARFDLAWEDGRVSSVSDGAGRAVHYAYSPDGCLTGVTDAAGEVWKLAYDAQGALLSETAPSGVPTVRNAYNTLGQVTNQMSASGQSWRFAFADGTLGWEADPFLRRVSYGFTSVGRESWREERDGAFHEFAYDACGHLVTNIDALGRLTVSLFDASNRLARVTEAAGTPDERTTAFAYDGRHRLIAVTNALERVTCMGYDDHDRLVCVTAPDGVSVTNVYDSRGLPTLTRTLDAAGNIVRETATVYNERGLPSEVTSTDAGTTLYRYDAVGNITNVTDALGHSLALFYNGRGQLTGMADALGHTTARLYTPEGRLEAAVDALGRTNRFLWTPGGKPAAVIYPDGSLSTNEYDIADRLAAVRGPRGNRVAFGLDPAGRVTNRTAAAWSDAAWYDAAGLVTARVDAVLGRTVTDYDLLDRLVAVTDPLGGGWTNSYDASGALIESKDPRGRSTVYARDVLGRLAVKLYPSGRSEGNGYNALGLLNAFTNAEGRVFRLSYDAQGRITAATNAAGEQVVRNSYDAVGNLKSREDGSGRVTGYDYDALNRRVETLYADGAWERFGYDAVGNLTAASNDASRLVFSYDALNRLANSETRVAGQTFTVGYGYALGGLVTNVTYPDGKAVRYGFDADGRVTNVTDWAGRAWTFTRDAAGRLTALSFPNGVSGSWTHDANHKVSGWSYTGGSPITGRSITRDAAGVKTKEQVTAGLFPNPQSPRRSANVFDVADRLNSATVAEGTNTYAESYLYDLNGALTNRQSAADERQYEYDCAGRLTYCQQSAVCNLAITYDALGNRLTTYAGNATRIWVTDHADPRKRPLMEADLNGVPQRYYIWGGGMLLAVVEADGVVHYAHSDEQGSVVALTDAAGVVTDQYCYGPYGTDWGHSGTNSIHFRWLGSHGVFNVGRSGLYLTRYRAYDAGMGRFLSQDPIGLGGGPNLYAYCMGSPLAYIDPLGLGAESWNVWTSLAGVAQLVGGLAEATGGYVFGTTTAPTVLGGIAGALVGTHGLDNAQAGLQQMISGHPVDTWTSQIIQGVGTSQSTANIINGVASVVLTLGTSYANMLANSEAVLTGAGATATSTASNATQIQNLQAELNSLQQVEAQLQQQLNNGRNLAARVLEQGGSVNPHGLGYEINVSIPEQISYVQRAIASITEQIRQLGQ